MPVRLTNTDELWQLWWECFEGVLVCNKIHTQPHAATETLCACFYVLLQTCMPQCILVDARQIAMIFQSRSYEAIPPWNMAV